MCEVVGGRGKRVAYVWRQGVPQCAPEVVMKTDHMVVLCTIIYPPPTQSRTSPTKSCQVPHPYLTSPLSSLLLLPNHPPPLLLHHAPLPAPLPPSNPPPSLEHAVKHGAVLVEVVARQLLPQGGRVLGRDAGQELHVAGGEWWGRGRGGVEGLKGRGWV